MRRAGNKAKEVAKQSGQTPGPQHLLDGQLMAIARPEGERKKEVRSANAMTKTSPNREKECWNCGKKGHLKVNCRGPKTQKKQGHPHRGVQKSQRGRQTSTGRSEFRPGTNRDNSRRLMSLVAEALLDQTLHRPNDKDANSNVAPSSLRNEPAENC